MYTVECVTLSTRALPLVLVYTNTLHVVVPPTARRATNPRMGYHLLGWDTMSGMLIPNRDPAPLGIPFILWIPVLLHA